MGSEEASEEIADYPCDCIGTILGSLLPVYPVVSEVFQVLV